MGTLVLISALDGTALLPEKLKRPLNIGEASHKHHVAAQRNTTHSLLDEDSLHNGNIGFVVSVFFWAFVIFRIFSSPKQFLTQHHGRDYSPQWSGWTP